MRALSGQAIASGDRPGLIEGYASLFHVVDLGDDMVMPGAFRQTLAQKGAAGIRMLWQHEAGEPIGTWLSLREDALGLRARGQLNLAVARAQEVYALLRDGAIDGLSIGFRTRKSVADRTSGVRRLLELDLWEISIVTFPMQPRARASVVKGAVPPSVRHWRDSAQAVQRQLQTLQLIF